MNKIIVAKIGGSVFSDKSKPYSLRETIIHRLSEIFGKVSKENTLALVLGGGSHGHAIVQELLEKHGKLENWHVPIINRVMEKLAMKIVGLMEYNDLRPLIIHPHSTCFFAKNSYQCNFEVAVQAVKRKIHILSYGDAIVSDRGAYILSGDDITVELALKLGIDRIFYLSNVDGIMDQTGRVIKETSLNYLLNNITITGSSGIDVTGGMRKKVESLTKLTKGTEVCIVNGLKPEIVRSALLGTRCKGTLIHV
ncbi:MAG: hypothetical protein F7C32_04150 [Desulfurococcales archaeon]|nr:hypothetical protein [Desulfurococcales archaeon]